MVHLALPWLRLVACPPRDGRQTSPYSQLGGSCTGEITQSRSFFPWSMEKCPIAPCPRPTRQAPLHQLQAGGVHSGTHRIGAPAASLQAPSNSTPISDPCHCCLPPELSPLGPRDTDVPDQAKDYISQRPWRHKMVSQPASPSMPKSIMGKWVGLPAPMRL